VAALQGAARDGGHAGVGAGGADGLAVEKLLDLVHVVTRAARDGDQRGHLGDLLDLLLDEPLHEKRQN